MQDLTELLPRPIVETLNYAKENLIQKYEKKEKGSPLASATALKFLLAANLPIGGELRWNISGKKSYRYGRQIFSKPVPVALRDKADADGRDCRRWAQIKTLPNPIRDGNCVRSSGQQSHWGLAADYIPVLPGVSQSSPLVRVPICLSLPT